jgi:uncharacterized protein YdeI (YjbR/CyaY-like superfamily)
LGKVRENNREFWPRIALIFTNGWCVGHERCLFLKDGNKKLMNANKENTKGMRQWRFDSMAEMKIRLSSDGKLKNAFERLSPGKQRECADYISEAKRGFEYERISIRENYTNDC